jgi:SAM-dependent methyltransferase
VDAYREDLAYIHHVGCGALASAAASKLTDELTRAGLFAGTIVDLGCGSGILARHLFNAGYALVGLDMSNAMLEIARAHAPGVEFRVGSFVSAQFPSCVAVAAIGEVLNYSFDEENGPITRLQLFSRVYEALALNGLFLFDTAGVDRLRPDAPARTFNEGDDWAVRVETELDQATKVLTRHITTFRRVAHTYRRHAETHRLQLIDPAEVLQSLGSIGFRVQPLTHYGVEPLPHGLTGFLAQKS